jgi:DNA mismatch endonuclease, patch repair protein
VLEGLAKDCRYNRKISNRSTRPSSLGWRGMDHVNPERRSHIMRLVKSTDTKPEIAVRKILHRLGFRFRLHNKGLPGKPDVVLPRWRTVILIHGCFWHRHPRCRKATTPKSRTDFWKEKFRANVRRDKRVCKRLEDLGWRVCTVWQCELATPDALAAKLGAFVHSN